MRQLIITLALVASVAGCGGSGTKEAQETAAPPPRTFTPTESGARCVVLIADRGYDTGQAYTECVRQSYKKWGYGAEAREAVSGATMSFQCITAYGLDACYSRLQGVGLVP